MNRVLIHDLPDWLVASYGNGLAYEIRPRSQTDWLLFQGDDAETFRREVEAGEKAGWGYDRIFTEIWNDAVG